MLVILKDVQLAAWLAAHLDVEMVLILAVRKGFLLAVLMVV